MSDYHSLAELVLEFENLTHEVGLVVGGDQLHQLAVNALRHYCAYGSLAIAAEGAPVTDALGRPLVGFGTLNSLGVAGVTETKVGSSIGLTNCEWAVIKPLFALYVESANAIHLEASRGLGVDVYGRSVSEIAAEIMREEEAIQAKAFQFSIFSV